MGWIGGRHLGGRRPPNATNCILFKVAEQSYGERSIVAGSQEFLEPEKLIGLLRRCHCFHGNISDHGPGNQLACPDLSRDRQPGLAG